MRSPTTEEILSKCPDVIPMKSIALVNKGGSFKRYGHDQHRWYSEKDRIKAAATYAVVGNSMRVQEITGIPSWRIRRWKTEPWWQAVIDRIRDEKDDALDVKFTQIVEKTVETINDRLENGDYIYDVKRQELKRKPIGGKEAAVITSIFMDKRTLLREKRNKHQESELVMDKLKKIAEEFKSFVKAKDVTQESERMKDPIIGSSKESMEYEHPNEEAHETVQKVVTP